MSSSQTSTPTKGQPSEKQLQLIGAIMANCHGKLDINWDKVAIQAKYKTAASAREVYRVTAKKLGWNAITGVGGDGATAATTGPTPTKVQKNTGKVGTKATTTAVGGGHGRCGCGRVLGHGHGGCRRGTKKGMSPLDCDMFFEATEQDRLAMTVKKNLQEDEEADADEEDQKEGVKKTLTGADNPFLPDKHKAQTDDDAGTFVLPDKYNTWLLS